MVVLIAGLEQFGMERVESWAQKFHKMCPKIWLWTWMDADTDNNYCYALQALETKPKILKTFA